jgi:hypothetical protein
MFHTQPEHEDQWSFNDYWPGNVANVCGAMW